MNVRERIIAIRLSESIRRQPKYADHIGVSVEEFKERTAVNATKDRKENKL